MSAREETLLIAALIERLGSAQADALLARLDVWTSGQKPNMQERPLKIGRRRTETRTHQNIREPQYKHEEISS